LEDLTLAFISSLNFNNDNILRGAMLVTDEHTKPLEFRVTALIQPTELQRTLYGDI
jgi:hypothetical protein